MGWLAGLTGLLTTLAQAHRLSLLVVQRNPAFFPFLLTQLLPVLRARGLMGKFAQLTEKDDLLREALKQAVQAMAAP